MGKETERRRSERLIFTRAQDIMVKFSFGRHSGRTEVGTVLNISRGGIFFTLRTARAHEFQQGDRLIYHEIRNKNDLKFSLDIPARVVWIMNDPADGYCGIGTQFLDEESEQQTNIHHFMAFYQNSKT